MSTFIIIVKQCYCHHNNVHLFRHKLCNTDNTASLLILLFLLLSFLFLIFASQVFWFYLSTVSIHMFNTRRSAPGSLRPWPLPRSAPSGANLQRHHCPQLNLAFGTATPLPLTAAQSTVLVAATEWTRETVTRKQRGLLRRRTWALRPLLTLRLRTATRGWSVSTSLGGWRTPLLQKAMKFEGCHVWPDLQVGGQVQAQNMRPENLL